ncbi:MAG: DUF4276 family protein, partial [Ignavibacteriaceae bacterium]
SDKTGFTIIPGIQDKTIRQLETIVDEYPNPELLNDGDTTAPSKRLASLIPGYKKALHGPLIAEEIGIHTLLNKCPRFKQWVEKIVETFYTIK